MTTLTESDVEYLALGWRTAHGPDIRPDAPNSERPEFGQVTLEHRLRDALLPKLVSGEAKLGSVGELTT